MRTILFLLSAFFMVGCASTIETKAPCDYHGHYCGKKIKINP